MNTPHYPGGPTDAELLHPPGDPAEDPERNPGPPQDWLDWRHGVYRETIDTLKQATGLDEDPAKDLECISEDYGEDFARFAYPNEVCIL